MAGFNLNFVVLMAMMVASMQFHGTVAQTRHVVGDALGWTIPPGGAVAYTTWASLQTFTVGDMLVFNFTNGQHDVAEVPEAAYEPCTATNPISLATISPTTLTLTTPGTHYYICTFTSHCQIGQKLTINVSAATTPAPPSVTPTSPPTIAPTPPSVLTPTSPPTIAPTPPSVTPTSPPTIAPTPPSVTPTSPPTIAPTPTPLVSPTSPPTIAPSTPPSATPPTTMPSPPSPPTPSPNSSPSSPPTNPTTPTTSGSSPTGSSTPPPPTNGASSFTTMAYVTFLTIALAFLNY